MAADSTGLVRSFLSAFRRSESYLLRSYVLAAAVVGLFVALLLVLGAVTWLATPAPLGQRALLGVIALAVLVPLFAPVLVVASRHRRGVVDRRSDALLAASGYAFVLGGYLALLISDPNPHDVTGPLAPVIAAIDALPRAAWPVPLLLAVGGIYLAIRFTRSSGQAGEVPDASAADDPEA